MSAPASRLAEELKLLMEALGSEGASGHDEAATECRACPVCQLITLLRAVRPEVVDHLEMATLSLAAAMRELMAPRGAPGKGPVPETVERIDISD